MDLPKYNMDLLFSDIYLSYFDELDKDARAAYAIAVAKMRFEKNNPSIPIADFAFKVVYDVGHELRVRATPIKENNA